MNRAENTFTLADLMHDFRCSDPDEMRIPIMAETARYYKTDPEGVEIMCRSMEERINAAAADKTVEIATKMIARGKLSLEEIAEYSGLPLEEIKALAEKNKPVAT